MTCQLLLLTKEKIVFGKREKIMHLNKNISAVKIGDYLQFKGRADRIIDVQSTKEHLEKVIENDENNNDNNNTNDDDDDGKSVSNYHFSEKGVTLNYKGLTIIHDEVN